MASNNAILLITLALINFMCISFAFDTTPLQDFCVATAQGSCKDPATVTANDFSFSGLNVAGNTSNRYGASVTRVSVAEVPGLNGLGITFQRTDMVIGGFVQPHYHPRATQVVVVIEGAMEIGFVTSFPQYKFINKVIHKGDVFVVPVGLVHTARNVYNGSTVAMLAFNSQNPGTNLPVALFAAKPPVDSGYLAGVFQLDKKTVQSLQKKKF